MNCPNCQTEVSQPGTCQNCGYPIALPSAASWGSKNVAWIITVVVLCFVIGVGALAFVGYRALQRRSLFLQAQNRGSTTGFLPAHRPVEHGAVVQPEELQGHGRLYFVAVGRQAIPVDSLADYYRLKFKIKITVLPKVELLPSACIPKRKQCAAEEITSAMTNAYPEIARTLDAAMIALTDEDLYPRGLGWEFTYSLHSARFAVVSTRRMDPAFWGDPPNDAARLASTKQMLTKYVALLYFHVHESFDPTSIMYSPLDPQSGPDDIYESDLHSEESANGMRGTPYPCLFFTYSYETHKIKADNPVLSDCKYGNPPGSLMEENFATNLGDGALQQKSIDLQVASTPAIQLRRLYASYYEDSTSFGMGGHHSYDTYMYSDGYYVQTTTTVGWGDGTVSVFNRMDKRKGFDPSYVFETHDDEIYGARMTWAVDHYKLQYRDGAWSTFLPCSSIHIRCYWIGYQDAKGHSLTFDRGPKRELNKLTASDHQGISFQVDDKLRTTAATATNGKRVTYEYDAQGCLAKVRRLDGQVTLYQYGPNHRMTAVSVVRRQGALPEAVLTNEYDSRGRVVKQTMPGVGVYTIQYVATGKNNLAIQWKITDPAGKIWRISIMDDDTYVARAAPTRFAAVPKR
jgi:YD repeat-containing protein